MARLARSALLAALLGLSTLALLPAPALPRAGDLDPTFGVNGRVIVDPSFIPDYSTDLTLDAKGRIVIIGNSVRPGFYWPIVIRLNPDGSLDQSFGEGGIARPKWAQIGSTGWGHIGPIEGVAVDGAGRIVVAGSVSSSSSGPYFPYESDIFVGRLREDGSEDESFSGDGMLTIDPGGTATEVGADVAVDGRDRVLVAGTVSAGDGSNRLAVARVTAAGVPDPGFDEDGIAIASLGESAFAKALALDAEGAVVAVGGATVGGNPQFAAARFDQSGQPDPAFDGDGLQTVDFLDAPAGEAADAVQVDPLGRLLLAGGGGVEDSVAPLVARLLPDGSLDSSFDGDGRQAIAPPATAVAHGVAVDARSRILVAGGAGTESNVEAFLARLHGDGAADDSFGANGLVRESSFTYFGQGARAVAVDSAGRYLILANARTGFGVARYLGEDEPALRPPRCRGRRATIVGTQGGDRLKGTRRRDVVVALGGGDRIRTLGGGDLVCAGRGRDRVRAGAGDDLVFGGPGGDRLFGQAGRDRLRGGAGGDLLAGGRGRDSLRGGSGRDRERQAPRILG